MILFHFEKGKKELSLVKIDGCCPEAMILWHRITSHRALINNSFIFHKKGKTSFWSAMKPLGLFFQKTAHNTLPLKEQKWPRLKKAMRGGGWGGKVDKMSRDESTRQCPRGPKGTGSGASEPAASVQSAWRDWCLKNWFPWEENLTDGRTFRL